MDQSVSNICERLSRVFTASKLEFDLNTKLLDLGDSLSILHLVLNVEFEFKIDIPDEDVVAFDTVNDLVLWLSNRL